MRFVIIESPFAGNVALNTEYARLAMADCLKRGEAAFASHLLYTQVLDDRESDHRARGIAAGLELAKRADLTVVYDDLGISTGMHLGIEAAKAAGRPVEFRRLFVPGSAR